MESGFFVIIVTLAAIIYTGITRFIQEKLINKKEMEGIQAESKQLNAQYKEASKRNDKVEMDGIMKKQMALFPKMSGMMFGQLKVLAVVLVVFFAFSWAIGNYDPTIKDDVAIELKDDGKNCDTDVDGVFTACYVLSNGTAGEWAADIQAFNSQQKSAERTLYFWFNHNSDPPQQPTGNLDASLNKERYAAGEVLRITAKPEKADMVKVTLNGGTAFYVDLPFTVPLVNIHRINGAYWWFISVTLVSGLLLSFALGKLRKKEVVKYIQP